ncbi:hypothetical protein TEA_022153 [Camellia sinensis var. sinensis]|uniref:Leucine-rich repeat-containing N-terminal plant-type domain-containing protein n=1 Tax=Camellia sinensis var. sinensis TaxID=542762 RepID=A0A4S4EH15_CAMSN|nr:hypothetical protein TEA_022153 [Camellia sinensis var. sinensis]
MRILLLFSWLFLIPFFAILIGKDRVLVSGQCLNDQSSLLLQLKNNLRYNSTVSVKLVNWTQTTDCCCWKGVTCDKEGHVTGLDLNSESISGGINHLSSLFSLQFLQNLNLAYNNFKFTQIPPSFGNLTRLTHLNLSNANFAGQIPIVLSRMTTLVTLDLSTLYFPGAPSLKLENPNLLKLVQNLTGLKTLLLDGVNISAQASQWCEAISSSLPNLQVLSLSNCNLSGPIDSSLQKLQFLSDIRLGQNNLSARVPEFFADLPNLRSLHLCSSNLHGKFPEKIFQVLTLEALDLSYNRLLQGFLPQFPPNGSLHTLVLSNTNFSGTLPDSVGNLKMLSRMELPGCNFSGLIPNTTANLTQLVYLDLSFNSFTGTIPSFQMSKNITYIDLSHNALTGQVPSTHFQGLSNLLNIDLAHNSFNGRIPLSLFSLPLLQKIQLSNNQFDGPVIGFSNQSLPSLDTLDLSRNKLQGSIPSSFFELRSLNVLSLSFNNFSGTIQLEMIQRLQNLTRLELSYNRLSINASDSHYMWLKLQIIDLASNNFRGDLPDKVFTHWTAMTVADHNAKSNFSHLKFEFLKLNGFYYQDTVTLNNKGMEMELVKILTIFTSIDISNNNFQGVIPNRVGDLKSLYVLNASRNALTGPIPSSIGNLAQLGSLDLSQNRLSGSIPMQLASLTFLSFLNLSYNQLVGMIPTGSQIQTFSDTSFKGNKGLCGYPLNISCNNASPVPSPAPSSNKSGSFVVKKFNWQFIFTGLGFGIGAGVIIGPLMFWKQGSKWCNKHIERFAQLILPSLGFIFAWCDYVQDEPKGNIEEENQDDKEESDEDEDENAREDKAFSGLYCVFCSKLDIHVKKGIHNPKCNCHHDSPSISSLSLSPPS